MLWKRHGRDTNFSSKWRGLQQCLGLGKRAIKHRAGSDAWLECDHTPNYQPVHFMYWHIVRSKVDFEFPPVFLGLLRAYETPLIGFGWFSGGTSAYSRSLDHDNLECAIDSFRHQNKLPETSDLYWIERYVLIFLIVLFLSQYPPAFPYLLVLWPALISWAPFAYLPLSWGPGWWSAA